MKKAPDAFRTISEVADILETPAHVLRFWESKFYQIRPVKRAGGRRYYRPDDVTLINGIRVLLQEQGMTIRGVQRVLQEQGVKHVAGLGAHLPAAEALLDDGAYEAQSVAESGQTIAGPGAPPDAQDGTDVPPVDPSLTVETEDPARPADAGLPATPEPLGEIARPDDAAQPANSGQALQSDPSDDASQPEDSLPGEDTVNLLDILEGIPAVSLGEAVEASTPDRPDTPDTPDTGDAKSDAQSAATGAHETPVELRDTGAEALPDAPPAAVAAPRPPEAAPEPADTPEPADMQAHAGTPGHADVPEPGIAPETGLEIGPATDPATDPATGPEMSPESGPETAAPRSPVTPEPVEDAMTDSESLAPPEALAPPETLADSDQAADGLPQGLLTPATPAANAELATREMISDEDTALREASERARIAQTLRNMPRGRLGAKRAPLDAVGRRIDVLLERMSEASGAGRW